MHPRISHPRSFILRLNLPHHEKRRSLAPHPRIKHTNRRATRDKKKLSKPATNTTQHPTDSTSSVTPRLPYKL
jgi:hypothetical protein